MFSIFKTKIEEDGWPSPEWLNDSYPKGFTWDAAQLQQYPWQLVFVYDQMMRRHRMHHLLKDDAVYQGTAFTMGSNWVLWKKKLGQGTFPISLKKTFFNIETGRIRGELYKVWSSRVLDLDEYKVNGVEFRRKKVELLVPYRHIDRILNADHNYEIVSTDLVAKVDAWMYMGRLKYWEDFLDAGYSGVVPCQIYRPASSLLIGNYYSFNLTEYDD
jgi:hypothetical protein